MVIHSHNKEKLYYEHLARLLLETYLADEYHEITVSDKPDLRMGNNHGIEVTRVLLKGLGETSGIFKHIKMKKLEEVDPRHVQSINNNSYRLFCPNGIICGYSPCSAVWVSDDELRYAFINKANIISNYKAVSIVDLFMFSPMFDWYEEDRIYRFLNWASQNYPNSFHQIIVFEMPYIFAYTLSTKAFRSIPVDKQTYRSCCEAAKNIVTGGPHDQL